jgi:hypothetical protein
VGFGHLTITRLLSVLEGFVPASAVVLLVRGLFGRGASIGGATVAFMGLVLGALSGQVAGRRLKRLHLQPADQRLPLLIALFFLPMGMVPVQPELLWGILEIHGVASLLGGVLAVFPAGMAMGVAWNFDSDKPGMDQRSRVRWTGLGVGLGILLATGAAMLLSMFKGALLVNLFAAPLLWPTLPAEGGRNLVVRMLFTLMVLLSSMLLLLV